MGRFCYQESSQQLSYSRVFIVANFFCPIFDGSMYIFQMFHQNKSFQFWFCYGLTEVSFWTPEANQKYEPDFNSLFICWKKSWKLYFICYFLISYLNICCAINSCIQLLIYMHIKFFGIKEHINIFYKEMKVLHLNLTWSTCGRNFGESFMCRHWTCCYIHVTSSNVMWHHTPFLPRSSSSLA